MQIIHGQLVPGTRLSESEIATRFSVSRQPVREAIEADIIKLLATDPDTALVRELRNQIAAQEKVVDDPDAFIELDDEFHRTLAVSAGNPMHGS